MKNYFILFVLLILNGCAYRFKATDYYCKNWGNIPLSRLESRDLKIYGTYPKDMTYPLEKAILHSAMNKPENNFNIIEDISTFRKYCPRNKYSIPDWMLKELKRKYK